MDTLVNYEARALRFSNHEYLFRILDAHAPGSGARYDITNIDQISIGRGEPGCRRDGTTLFIRCTDPYMSSVHATLIRDHAHWILCDEGSRNGVLVNGSRQARAIALEHDLIEVGRTFFMLGNNRGLPASDLELTASSSDSELQTLDPGLTCAFAELAQLSRSTAPILITGPSGSGKEHAARFIHAVSARTGMLVEVNCGAFANGVLESELFGHRRGAFTGAVGDRAGLISTSDGGTLFLDEIGDMSPAGQAAMLRVIEDHRVRPVGASSSHPVDLRVVAATHRDLKDLVERGTFRDDLLARLSGGELVLPPLAERKVDLGLLIGAIAPGISLTNAAARALLAYGWPRNIRELVRVLERGRTLAPTSEIALAHLNIAAPERSTRTDDVRAELVALVEHHQGNVSRIAAALGKARSQVQRILKRYQIEAARYRIDARNERLAD